MTTNTHDSENMNQTEIVNDILHKLHIEDVKLIRALSYNELVSNQVHFINHIRNFYGLNNSSHPVRQLDHSKSPDRLATEIAVDIWSIINRTNNTPPAPKQLA